MREHEQLPVPSVEEFRAGYELPGGAFGPFNTKHAEMNDETVAVFKKVISDVFPHFQRCLIEMSNTQEETSTANAAVDYLVCLMLGEVVRTTTENVQDYPKRMRMHLEGLEQGGMLIAIKNMSHDAIAESMASV